MRNWCRQQRQVQLLQQQWVGELQQLGIDDHWSIETHGQCQSCPYPKLFCTVLAYLHDHIQVVADVMREETHVKVCMSIGPHLCATQ